MGRGLDSWGRSFLQSAVWSSTAAVGGRRLRWCHVPCGSCRRIGWASGWLPATMAFTLYSLLQAALLCVNAIAVLHEERFLKNSEWGRGAG